VGSKCSGDPFLRRRRPRSFRALEKSFYGSGAHAASEGDAGNFRGCQRCWRHASPFRVTPGRWAVRL